MPLSTARSPGSAAAHIQAIRAASDTAQAGAHVAWRGHPQRAEPRDLCMERPGSAGCSDVRPVMPAVGRVHHSWCWSFRRPSRTGVGALAQRHCLVVHFVPLRRRVGRRHRRVLRSGRGSRRSRSPGARSGHVVRGSRLLYPGEPRAPNGPKDAATSASTSSPAPASSSDPTPRR
jgi:hypothetical protein